MRISIPFLAATLSALLISTCLAQGQIRLDAYGQPLPEGAIARLGRVKFGMLGSPIAAAWSPDGTRLAAVNNDKPHLLIWEWPSGRLLHELQLPQATFGKLLFSPDGKYLFWTDGFGGNDTSRLWRANDLTEVELPGSLAKFGRACTFSTDSKRLAFASTVEPVVDWVIGKNQEKVYPGTRTEAVALQWTNANELIAALGDRLSVGVKNLSTGKSLLRVDVKNFPNRPLAISPDGKWLAYQYDQLTVLIREIDGKREHSIHIDKQDIPANFTFTPDSKTAAVLTIGHMIQVSLESGEIRLDKKRSGYVDAVFSPDAKLFATFGPNHDYAVIIHDAIQGEPLPLTIGHTRPIARTFWTLDGKEIVTYGANNGDAAISFWNARRGNRISTWRVNSGGIGWTGNSHYAFRYALPQRFDRFQIWDWRVPELVYSLPNPHRFYVAQVAFSSDQRRLVSCGTGATPDEMELLDLTTGKKLWKAPLAFRTIRRVEFLPGDDSIMVVASSGIEVVDHIDQETPTIRKLVNVLDPQISLSSDKKLMAITGWSSSGQIKSRTRIVEITTTKNVLELGDSLAGIGIAVTNDARTCLVGTPEHVHLFDAASGKMLATIATGAGHSFSLSPDDKLLVCPGKGLDASTPLVWDVEKWTHRKREGINSATADQIADWCKQLRDSDAAVGIRAAWNLADNPKLAVPALRAIFGKSPKPDATRVTELIDKLGDRKFAVRQAAQRELIQMGHEAQDTVEQAIQKKTSPEQMARLKSVLAIIKGSSASEAVFASRSITALELAGTKEAKVLLEDAAKRIPANQVAIEARRALRRWHERP